MNILVALALFVAVVQATPASRLADVTLNPRHTAEEWDSIYAAAKANTPEDTTGLVPGTIPQPEDAGKVFVEPEERITSGTTATRGQFPWQALIVTNRNSFSGGSLISPEWVLTCAHCIDGYTSFSVSLGSTSRSATEAGAVTQNSRQAIMHSNYNANTIVNDIALLRLTSAVSLTNYINVVRLPRQAEASTTFAGLVAVVSGFGINKSGTNEVSNVLLYADLEIITNTECARSYGSFIHDTTICTIGTNGRGPCTGDSGGPLTVRETDGRYTLVGAVSFGDGNCEAIRPEAYTRVSKYLAWISSHTGVAIAA